MMSGPMTPSVGLTRSTRIVLSILAVELVVLAVTGVALFFLYQPSAALAWDDIVLSNPAGVTFVGALRGVHQVTSALTLWTALAAAVLTAIEPTTRVRWRRSLALSIGMLLAVQLASATGYLLPWDQLALWAVTVGTDMKGYRPLLDDQVRFVLLDGAEIGKNTLLRWVIIHMLIGVGAAALTWAALRRLRFGRVNNRPTSETKDHRLESQEPATRNPQPATRNPQVSPSMSADPVGSGGRSSRPQTIRT